MAKRGRGKPTSYRKRFCDQLISEMSNGLSYTGCAGIFGVTFQTLYDWEKRYPEWKEAKEIGIAKSQVFWEKIGMQYIVSNPRGPCLNSSVWIFNMKNRFGWRDRTEISASEGDGQGSSLIIDLGPVLGHSGASGSEPEGGS